MERNSELSKFYKKGHDERVETLAEYADLTEDEQQLLKQLKGLDFAQADRMIENVYGVMPLPLGIATHFRVNGKDYLVPMALEEPSVVAAASNAAKMARTSGGFKASSTEPLMIAQIQLVKLKDAEAARKAVMAHKQELVELADKVFPSMKQFGGGAKDLDARVIETVRGKQLIVHLIVDVRDAMGANSINSMAEGLAPRLEQLTGGKVLLRIISNLAVHRLFRSETVWTKEALAESVKEQGLKGEEVVEAILDAWAFGAADPFRGTTHNKGIMNGIDAVTLATGNDFRAVEAGAHSYAALKGAALTAYKLNADGDIEGKILLPLAVGTVGGSMKANPTAAMCLKIIGARTSGELAQVMAAVGLAQNFAALRAMASEGIQKGHMRLHARHIATAAGAKPEEVDELVAQMQADNAINEMGAKKALDEIRGGKKVHKT